MFWIEFILVIGAIFIGARLGGIGLGVMGGMGLIILTFVFGLQPTAPPVDVMLMIISVITAASCLQAAGGMDYLVSIAENILKKNPKRITFYAPLVTYTFTLFAGTGHVAYSVLPVIAEVATKTKVRPERPLSIAVIASQQAITASPISAATVALVALLSSQGIELIDILMICIPSTICGVLVGALSVNKMGKELEKDPEFIEKMKDPEFVKALFDEKSEKEETKTIDKKAKISVALFLFAAISVVFFGTFPELRPSWNIDGELIKLGMPATIEMVMLTIAALILITSKVNVKAVSNGTIFKAGSEAVIAIFGIAWMGDTFIKGNYEFISSGIENMVQSAPWTFAIALFIMSILLYSQAATIRALMPLGIALGIPYPFLIAMFPAVNGYFFIPNYPTVVAAIGFDRTGTTKIGKYVINHSFMRPGLVASFVAIAVGFGLAGILL
ncbi:anaerobic C4-dicarboxylate transporter [Aureibacter tunicatorum]|uniref:Anaerobic C4-dicarboxylate transporter DcuA n=1 Tax=Aureibacter tunicatorum TaxID=866807 RepID=A0AAE3XP79_9BACT|nr:anaerobic C4-dicarboxylate transporter [Aureibacter tunicatorum]MDR6239588.1 anaerobic C4-dicarboxylate transporter DcuA [Aureibacter tunicatorum]BDD04065.1 C4-dicarboxylate ABC transporter [Aureibacter tunicatorum]